MNWLVFQTLEAAQDAIVQININAGYPNASTKTTTWAVPEATLSGTYVFLAPPINFMYNVTGYTETPSDPTWFPAPSIASLMPG